MKFKVPCFALSRYTCISKI